MRVGCGSATIGIFAQQWFGQADEVVVVDDHITGVLTEHQAGSCLDMAPIGHPAARPQVDAGALLPGRQPGHRLGRHRHHRSAVDHRGLGSEDGARPGPAPADGLDHRRGCRLVRARRAAACRGRAEMPAEVQRVVERIGENCEPSLAHGAVRRRRRRQPARRRHREPGAADPLDQEPARQRHLRRRAGLRLAGRRHHGDGRRARGCPTTASAPCRRRPSSRRSSSRMRLDDYRALGGHMDACAPLERGARRAARWQHRWRADRAPLAAATRPIPGRSATADARLTRVPRDAPLDDGRWHFQHGPIDCIVGADGERGAVAAAHRARLARFQRRARRAGRRAAAAARRPVGAAGAAPLRGPGRAAHVSRPAGRMPRRPLHHADGGGGRQRRRGADRRLRRAAASRAPGSTTAATSRCTSRRAARARSACSPISRARPRRPAARRPLRDRRRPRRCAASPPAGWRGRSFSLGIADSVTVLAATAARRRRGGDRDRQCGRRRRSAHRPPRRPAQLRDDSDLGERLVTCAVPPLPERWWRRRSPTVAAPRRTRSPPDASSPRCSACRAGPRPAARTHFFHRRHAHERSLLPRRPHRARHRRLARHRPHDRRRLPARRARGSTSRRARPRPATRPPRELSPLGAVRLAAGGRLDDAQGVAGAGRRLSPRASDSSTSSSTTPARPGARRSTAFPRRAGTRSST